MQLKKDHHTNALRVWPVWVRVKQRCCVGGSLPREEKRPKFSWIWRHVKSQTHWNGLLATIRRNEKWSCRQMQNSWPKNHMETLSSSKNLSRIAYMQIYKFLFVSHNNERNQHSQQGIVITQGQKYGFRKPVSHWILCHSCCNKTCTYWTVVKGFLFDGGFIYCKFLHSYFKPSHTRNGLERTAESSGTMWTETSENPRTNLLVVYDSNFRSIKHTA